MILSDVTSGNRIAINNAGNADQSMPVVGRSGSQLTLSALKPGDAIQAKVVSRDGDNVRLQVDGNKYIDAKLSSGINVDAGKDIVFEVRSTGSGITLSPLFTNTSSDPNISKALSMAGLPLTSDTVLMTKSMMQAGMSIDRASLTNMFKDISVFAGVGVEDIVDLHRLGIKVDADNLEQISAYKNLSYQLGEGMNDVAGKVTELVDNLISGNAASVDGAGLDSIYNASKIFEGVLDIAAEFDWEAVENSASELTMEQTAIANTNNTESESSLTAAQKALQLLGEKTKDLSLAEDAADNTTSNATLTPDSVQKLKDEIVKLMTSAEGTEVNSDTVKVSDGNSSDANMGKLLDFLKSTVGKAIAEGDKQSLSHIMNNPVIKDTVMAAMKAQWNISPADVAQKENIRDLYSKLQRQLGIINESLENTGMKDSAAGNAAGNMSNNLDFLNQVNQMYSYIQLPLKLSTGDDAHGDLYVYSNGKKMSSEDGKVTALLHLDMEHLGPLDVYVSLDTSGFDKKVSTQFTVADESILDFLSMHMDELTKRLEDKGYSCSARMSIKGNSTDDENESGNTGKRGIEPVLDMTGSMKLAEYSFDVRT